MNVNLTGKKRIATPLIDPDRNFQFGNLAEEEATLTYRPLGRSSSRFSVHPPSGTTSSG
jgi:hypothetical protein